MARSSCIYLIRSKDGPAFHGAGTVKHEIHSLVRRLNIDVATVELVRFRDGQVDGGKVIPWEFK